jgi:predicted metalloendopeptidase
MSNSENKTRKGASALSAKELEHQMRKVVKQAEANYKPPSDYALECFMRYYTQSQQPDGDKAEILSNLLDLDPSSNTLSHLAALQDREALQQCTTLMVDYAISSPDLEAEEGEVPRTMATLINLMVSLTVDARK